MRRFARSLALEFLDSPLEALVCNVDGRAISPSRRLRSKYRSSGSDRHLRNAVPAVSGLAVFEKLDVDRSDRSQVFPEVPQLLLREALDGHRGLVVPPVNPYLHAPPALRGGRRTMGPVAWLTWSLAPHSLAEVSHHSIQPLLAVRTGRIYMNDASILLPVPGSFPGPRQD